MAKKLTSYFISLVREACLRAFWKKKSLDSFLRQNHISAKALEPLFQDKTKAEFLSDIFDKLSINQDTRKQSVILNIARELSAMDSFPDLYGYEDTAQKIIMAKNAVDILRENLKKLEVTYINTGDEELRRKAKEKRDACSSYESQFKEFEKRLIKISQEAGQQSAGYEFETWIYDFSVFNDIEVRLPYKDPSGRQIDGAMTIDGDTMLIEAKCTAQPINVDAIDSFRSKIQTKADNTLGLMISLNGYNQGAIQEASQGRTPLVLIDGTHLFNIVMTQRASFKEVIARIKRHAAQTGCPYLSSTDF